MRVNNNCFYANVFVRELALCGVRYACVSPGSRNTPLSIAFYQHPEIKTIVLVDERSCAFFALGLAKQTGNPVAIVCTSGTAAAEFFPAVVEAYTAGIGLIVCTTDRPEYLRGSGTNQMINQEDLYAHHIKEYLSAGRPELTEGGLRFLRSIASRSFFRAKEGGPVQINFQFTKPLEPSSLNAEIEEDTEVITTGERLHNFMAPDEYSTEALRPIIKILKEASSGLIFVGSLETDPRLPGILNEVSNQLSFPVFAEASSSLRFSKCAKDNFIYNYDSILRSKTLRNNFNPEVILHIGSSVLSNAASSFLAEKDADIIEVNKTGSIKDQCLKTRYIIKSEPFKFLKEISGALHKRTLRQNTDLKGLKELDQMVEKAKSKILKKGDGKSEVFLAARLPEIFPENCTLMVSNSLPIRDMDSFAGMLNTGLRIYTNRGASGIDGITSTAAGIAMAAGTPVILITGDLAFYHDMNALLPVKQKNIPLKIILINNSGGGIFRMLPIAEKSKSFEDLFITDTGLDFSMFVKAYEGRYFRPKSLGSLEEELRAEYEKPGLAVFEFKTDPEYSKEQRLLLRRKVRDIVDDYFKEN